MSGQQPWQQGGWQQQGGQGLPAGQGGQSMPPGAGGNGRPDPDDVRRAARRRWWPGQPVPDHATAMAGQFEEDWDDDVSQEARKMALRLAAQRELDTQAWQPPDATPDLAAELALPRSGEPHRIHGLAGANHNVLLAGPRKTGKTQLLGNLTGSLSCSRWVQSQPPPAPQQLVPANFLGMTPCWLAGNVAYVNLEMDKDDWLDVFRAMPAWAYSPARIFPLHRRGQPLPVITSPAARDWFVAWLAERRIEVLIIDTWGQFCARNGVRRMNDDGEVLPVLTGLDDIKKAAGVASVYISIHMPHQTGERHLERFKGAGAVGDWADTLWTFTADDEGTRFLGAVGRARIEVPDCALDFAPVTGLLSWGTSGTKAQTQASRMEAKITAALEKARPSGMLTEGLLTAVGGHRDTVRGKLIKMQADGTVVMVPKGRAKRYFLPGDLPS